MTNESKFINPEHCVFCGGKCCKKFWIVYPKNAKNKTMLSEVERFGLLDTNSIEVVEKKKEWHAVFNFPCEAFKDGKCQIYDDRPLLCRQYPHTTDDEECPYLQRCDER